MSTPAAPQLSIPVEPATRSAFPFTALVGQPQLQRALQLAAIDPGIGGVLNRGEEIHETPRPYRQEHFDPVACMKMPRNTLVIAILGTQ